MRIIFLLLNCVAFIYAQGPGNPISSQYNECGFNPQKSPIAVQLAKFPWTVSILKNKLGTADKNSFDYHCGGSIIYPSVILTAAHCFTDFKEPEKLKVQAGLNNQHEREVKKIILHENHSIDPVLNDVALLLLESPLNLDPDVRTLCLPKPSQTVPTINNCFIVARENDTLKRVELPIVDHEKCQEAIRATRLGKDFVLDKSAICAGGEPGKDSCTNDGGSPLICPRENNKTPFKDQLEQIGIVSWGIGCNTSLPGIYTSVPYMKDWINQQINQNNIDLTQYHEKE